MISKCHNHLRCDYCPRKAKEEHRLTHLVIEWSKVEDDIEQITKALEGAVAEKLKLINLLK